MCSAFGRARTADSSGPFRPRRTQEKSHSKSIVSAAARCSWLKRGDAAPGVVAPHPCEEKTPFTHRRAPPGRVANLLPGTPRQKSARRARHAPTQAPTIFRSTGYLTARSRVTAGQQRGGSGGTRPRSAKTRRSGMTARQRESTMQRRGQSARGWRSKRCVGKHAPGQRRLRRGELSSGSLRAQMLDWVAWLRVKSARR